MHGQTDGGHHIIPPVFEGHKIKTVEKEVKPQVIHLSIKCIKLVIQNCAFMVFLTQMMLLSCQIVAPPLPCCTETDDGVWALLLFQKANKFLLFSCGPLMLTHLVALRIIWYSLK